jgi:hypothetical protein
MRAAKIDRHKNDSVGEMQLHTPLPNVICSIVATRAMHITTRTAKVGWERSMCEPQGSIGVNSILQTKQRPEIRMWAALDSVIPHPISIVPLISYLVCAYGARGSGKSVPQPEVSFDREHTQ